MEELTKEFYDLWINAFRESLPEQARPVFDRVARPGKEAAVRRAVGTLDQLERKRLIRELNARKDQQ
jgi:hypothetical protein